VAAAPVAGTAVLDMAHEQQRSDDSRRKSRAGWEWGASGETWFLLDAKAGIRVGEDGVRHTWAAEDWARHRARGRRCSGLRRVAGSCRTCAGRRPVTGCERFNRLLRLTSGLGFISIFH
jgi:hypothetical protein